MTLQDSINLLTSSLTNFVHILGIIVVPVIAALVVFVFGLVVATLLQRLWLEIAKLLNFEKNLAVFSNYKTLAKFDANATLSQIVSFLIWWGIVLVFTFTALELLGINIGKVFATYLAFIPSVVVAASFLIVGLVVAYFAYLLIGAIGSLASFPYFVWVGRAIAAFVVVFSTIVALQSLGTSSEMIRFIEIGFIAGSALALGLAGRDLASDIIKKVRTFVR